MKVPRTVSAYYSKQPRAHKEALLELRAKILEVIPNAEEIMKYSMPTFLHQGTAVAGLRANRNFIGFYPYSGSVIDKFPEIKGKYDTTVGSVHVPLDKPLSKVEVRKLVKTRISLCPVARGEVDLKKYKGLDGEWKEVGLAAPGRRGLIDKGLTSLSQLSKFSEEEISRVHGMGASGMKLLRTAMKKQGIKFRTK